MPRFVLSGVLFCPAAGKLARLLPPGAAGLSRAHGVGHIGENDAERRSFSAFLTSIDPSLRHMYSYSTIDSRTRDRTPPRWLAHQTTPRIPAAPPSLHKYLQSSVLHSTASDLDRAPHANKQTSKGQARRPSKPIHCLFPKQASLRLEKALSSKYSALQQPPNLTRLSTCLPPVRARPSPDPAACRTRRRSHCTLNLRGRSAGARRRAWAGVGTSRADSGSIRGCCIIQHQIDDDEVKSLWMACCNTVAAARVHAHGCTWATTSIRLVSLRPPDDEFGSCRLL